MNRDSPIPLPPLGLCSSVGEASRSRMAAWSTVLLASPILSSLAVPATAIWEADPAAAGAVGRWGKVGGVLSWEFWLCWLPTFGYSDMDMLNGLPPRKDGGVKDHGWSCHRDDWWGADLGLCWIWNKRCMHINRLIGSLVRPGFIPVEYYIKSVNQTNFNLQIVKHTIKTFITFVSNTNSKTCKCPRKCTIYPNKHKNVPPKLPTAKVLIWVR